MRLARRSQQWEDENNTWAIYSRQVNKQSSFIIKSSNQILFYRSLFIERLW